MPSWTQLVIWRRWMLTYLTRIWILQLLKSLTETNHILPGILLQLLWRILWFLLSYILRFLLWSILWFPRWLSLGLYLLWIFFTKDVIQVLPRRLNAAPMIGLMWSITEKCDNLFISYQFTKKTYQSSFKSWSIVPFYDLPDNCRYPVVCS